MTSMRVILALIQTPCMNHRPKYWVYRRVFEDWALLKCAIHCCIGSIRNCQRQIVLIAVATPPGGKGSIAQHDPFEGDRSIV